MAKKISAILCVIGFTGFWTYGFIALSGIFGDRPASPMVFVLCLVGLAVGIYGWVNVMKHAPKMRGQRAAARVRLDQEFMNGSS